MSISIRTSFMLGAWILLFPLYSAAQGCSDDAASLYHDCLLGCGAVNSVNYYTCLQSCNQTADFADCVADTGGRPGGLQYQALLRGVTEKCNCPQGNMSKSAKGRCVSQIAQMTSAIKALSFFGVIDPDFSARFKSGLRAGKKSCQQ